MNIIIRKADVYDKEQIFCLVKNFATSFEPEIGAFRKSFDNLINDNSAIILVAEVNKCIIGYCLGFDHYTFYANGKVAWLEEIMVEESHRKKGTGEMLMKEFEAWSESRESKLIGLATRRAASFYTAIGYHESATFFRKIL